MNGRSSSSYRAEDFQLLNVLGKGSFGTVSQVVHKQSGNIYAMKIVEKKLLVERQLQDQLKREVVTQLKANHTNVVRMYYYFEDKDAVSCLLEYADQGQLFAYLKRQPGGLPEPRAALFFVDTTRGIQYLHGLGVVHRDIKPENILLFTEALTCKIADLGWCVELTPDRPERLTFCGTMDYLPPEMLYDEPHDFSLDLWALGVLLFEMIVARPPFVGSSPKQVADEICSGELQIPSGCMSSGPAEIIRGLLVRDKNHRWSIDKVLSHPWAISHGGSVDAISMEVTVPARAPPETKLDSTMDRVALDETKAVGWHATIAHEQKPSAAQDASSACVLEASSSTSQNLATVNADLLSRIRHHMDDMSKSFEAKLAVQQDKQKDNIIERKRTAMDSCSDEWKQHGEVLESMPQDGQIDVCTTSCFKEYTTDIERTLPCVDSHNLQSSLLQVEQQDRVRSCTKDRIADCPTFMEKSSASVHVSESSDDDDHEGVGTWPLRRKLSKPQASTDTEFLTNVDDCNIRLDEFDRQLVKDVPKPHETPSTALTATRGSREMSLDGKDVRKDIQDTRVSAADHLYNDSNSLHDQRCDHSEDEATWSSTSLIVDAGSSVWTTLFTGLVALGAVSTAERNTVAEQQSPVMIGSVAEQQSHKIGRRCWAPGQG